MVEGKEVERIIVHSMFDLCYTHGKPIIAENWCVIYSY